MPYVHTWEKHGVYRRFYGHFARSESMESSQSLASDACIDGFQYDPSDYLQAKRHDMTAKDVGHRVAQAAALGCMNPQFLAALASAGENVLRILRQFKATSESTHAVEISAMAVDARRWIAKRLVARGHAGAGRAARR